MTKFNRSTPRLLCSLSVGILLLGSAAHAQYAYVSGTDDSNYNYNTNTGTFSYSFGLMNLANGQIQKISSLSSSFFGLQFVGNTLYGVNSNGGLYSINTSTGATTFIKKVDSTNGGLLVPGSLTMSTSGTVYNLQNTTDLSPTPAYIYKININGASTSVAPLSTVGGGTGNTGITGNGGLAFDPTTGLLFGTQGQYGDGLFSVNPTTGNVTTITTNSNFGSPAKSVYSLFYNLNANSLYAIDFADSATTGSVYSVNKVTGQATAVTSYNTAGFGHVESAAAVTPEAGPVVLFGSALLSVVAMRKKKKTA